MTAPDSTHACWRTAYTFVLSCAFAALSLGCDKAATPAEGAAVCKHFAELAIDDLPSRELLTDEAREGRVTFLESFCADSIEEGEPLTETESSCMQASTSLEELAQCRENDSFLDSLSQ